MNKKKGSPASPVWVGRTCFPAPPPNERPAVHSHQDEVAPHWGRLTHDVPHVWGEGLGAVHQLHDLQRLQLWHPTQQGTQQGLWATQQTQTQSSAWGASKLPSPIHLASCSFLKVSWGGFVRRANWAIYQKQKPWWNYGISLQSSCHKDREKKILCRKERCYGRADTMCGPQIKSHRHQW